MQKHKNIKEKNGFAALGVFLAIAAVILIFSGFFAYQYPQIQKIREGAYRSQEDCEQKTGQKCGYGMCDVIPPGKTVEEVCGKNFRQGWMPFNQTPKKTAARYDPPGAIPSRANSTL